MSERQIITQVVSASEARQQFGKLLKQVHNQNVRIIVEKGGIPVAALVSLADLQRLENMKQERAERLKILEQLRAPFREIPPEQVEKDVAAVIEEVRREQRASAVSHDKT